MIRTKEKDYLKSCLGRKIVNKANIFIDVPLLCNSFCSLFYYVSYFFNYKFLTILSLMIIIIMNIVFNAYKIFSSAFNINPK